MLNKYAIRFCIFLFIISAMAACTHKPEFDRTKIQNVYILTPDELLDCKKPMVLTQNELDEMKNSQNKLMRDYVTLMYLEYESCYNNSQRAKSYNQSIKDRNLFITESGEK